MLNEPASYAPGSLAPFPPSPLPLPPHLVPTYLRQLHERFMLVLQEKSPFRWRGVKRNSFKTGARERQTFANILPQLHGML